MASNKYQGSSWYASQMLPPDRPPAFVLNLARLPRRMVDHILNDLPISKVLQILCYGNQSLKDSVFNHQNYGRLFLSSQESTPVIELFRLYRDICRFQHTPIASPWAHISVIYIHVTNAIRGYLMNPLTRVHNELRSSVLRALHLPPLDEAILSAHSSIPCPKLDKDNIEALKERWNWIKQTKIGLNIAKAEQLNKVADIIATYPGKIRLKKPLDPSQDGPRPNAEHIANNFRGAARRVLKDRKTNHGNQVRCHKAVDFIELVPYDKYLWLFLDTVRDYPPANKETNLQNMDRLLDRLNIHESLEGPTYQYPENIAALIDVINKGLINVYTGSPLLLVPRIDWNSVSSSSGDAKPIFFLDTKPHPPHLSEELHRCLCRKVMPYDEREYEWLKAFLEVVTWMEDNLLKGNNSSTDIS